MRRAHMTVPMEDLDNKAFVSSPEDAFLRREERIEIRKKLDTLSEKYREAVILHYFANKSISEISSLLEVPEGTVKFRLHEGRKKLREELIHIMHKEKKQAEKNNIWKNIESELHRAREAFHAYQKGKSNEICDVLIEQFEDMDPATLSKDEIRAIIRVYTQKFYANTHLAPPEKNIIYCKKCMELAEMSEDEALMAERYTFHAIALTNMDKKEEALCYYKKALHLAEKLKDVPQIAVLNYWLGTGYLNKETPDITKAKACFKKAVTYRDALFQSDLGKSAYTLAYSAFVAMERAKYPNQLEGFHATEPCIVKTENGLQLQEQPGFWGGKYARFCTVDIFTHIAHVRPFLSNDVREGYAFQTLSRSRYEVVSNRARVQTPSGIFENCLHIRYTEKTGDKIDLKHNGIRDLFYAPNVGLAQMKFKAISGFAYTVKLSEYHVTPIENGDLCDRFLPLTVGNVWYYDTYGADGKRFDKVEYENRFEVVAKCTGNTVASRWAPIPLPNTMDKHKNDSITSIAHSGWICKKD